MTQVIKKTKQLPAGDARPVMMLADIAKQASEVVLEARKTAARIKTEARADAEVAKRQAREQGYNEGFAEGQAHGIQDGARTATDQARASVDDRARELADQAMSILVALKESGERQYQHSADEVLSFAIDLSTKIVGRLARCDISVARGNLIKAMKLAHAEGEIIVSVNPGQLQALARDFAEFVETIDASGRAKLVADTRIAPGGVKITTAKGVIDATVEMQLDKVVSALGAGGLVCSPQVSGKSNVVPHLRIIDSDVSI
jgi:flagellar assembly protein FliH